MSKNRQDVELRVDRYTRVCLTVIAGLLTVLILGLWADAVPSTRPALGSSSGVPDAGQQRERTIKAVQENTAKLDRLIRLFETGTAKVQIAGAEQPAGAKRGAKPVPK